MYIKLQTDENSLKAINNALVNTLNTYPSIAYDSNFFYKVDKISGKSLKVIAWIIEYYKDTTIEISDNIDI